jgi:hypothetical protein
MAKQPQLAAAAWHLLAAAAWLMANSAMKAQWRINGEKRRRKPSSENIWR